jgi:putative oxidoreductase
MLTLLRYLLAPVPAPTLLNTGLLLFRVLFGLALLRVHGWEKIAHYAEEVQSIPDPLGLGGPTNMVFAIASDVVGAILIMLGLATRPAALLILGTTLVGLLLVHIGDDWHGRDVPLVYSIMALTLAVLGPGRYSLDARLSEWFPKSMPDPMLDLGYNSASL